MIFILQRRELTHTAKGFAKIHPGAGVVASHIRVPKFESHF